MRVRRYLFGCFLFGIAIGCGAEEAPVPAFPEELSATLENIAVSEFANVGAHGATVRVVMPNGDTWETALGLAYTEPDITAEPDDRFRIGSITKTFNAAVVLQLAEEGLLSLDDALDDWVPGFDLGPEVTIRHLLSHTAGVFNYTDDPGFLEQPATEPEGVIEFALEQGPVFAAGESMSYSNTGYFLTGLVIEAATGLTFHEAVRVRLLEPLDLQATYLDGYESHPIGRVDGHVLRHKMEKVIPDFSMSWAWAAGGMVSNVADLCTWGRVLIRPESEEDAVLSKDSRDRMQHPAITPYGEPGTYSTGLTHTQRAERDVMGHTGSTMGFKGEMFVDRETGACVAISTNDFLSTPLDLSHAIWGALDAYFAE